MRRYHVQQALLAARLSPLEEAASIAAVVLVASLPTSVARVSVRARRRPVFNAAAVALALGLPAAVCLVVVGRSSGGGSPSRDPRHQAAARAARRPRARSGA